MANANTNSKTVSDEEMIRLLREDAGNFDALYIKHRVYCLNFMKKINYNDELNIDIYHEAIIYFREKVLSGNFTLTCSIQTYLNSICRNQILVRLKRSEKHSQYSEEFDERITDWYEPEEIESDDRMNAILKGLEMLKSLGGKCYEILKRFFYENNSMENSLRP
ncbi:MAG: sigma-70 family RNA polymerase sigma factor [Sphingobacteriaceae bacterium]|nr:sigma-70 family RNA polymerase sigma factor [Sphingobacteriaceae bacterium]